MEFRVICGKVAVNVPILVHYQSVGVMPKLMMDEAFAWVPAVEGGHRWRVTLKGVGYCVEGSKNCQLKWSGLSSVSKSWNFDNI